MNSTLTFVECPRDAMQGWHHFIPTEKKVNYLNALLRVGFDVLDFGSFVSPKAIPQLADTKEVIPQLNLSDSTSKLLSIVANVRGAEDAVAFDEIQYLGFPFSISETFQLRNTNKTIMESLKEVEKIQNLCIKHRKELVVYISMGFGNPYGDPYNAAVAIDWVGKLAGLEIKTLAMSDTVGVATPEIIAYLFSNLIPEFSQLTIGAHFHSAPNTWREKVESAYANGCTRFDSALKGIGGCPMAEDNLVGNIATENLINWCAENKIIHQLNEAEFGKAMLLASEIFF
ncbi:MAG: hydroxymethylglutaryl-CoA lyase [Bacteroidetes bacterium]|nr:hydroxymethylglutaryl-CoA lyase [Bacteroidota bacterium]MBS1739746.1 hydroxymethylglutaryl-CoA lyase [Bacteroidota bacterium]